MATFCALTDTELLRTRHVGAGFPAPAPGPRALVHGRRVPKVRDVVRADARGQPAGVKLFSAPDAAQDAGARQGGAPARRVHGHRRRTRRRGRDVGDVFDRSRRFRRGGADSFPSSQSSSCFDAAMCSRPGEWRRAVLRATPRSPARSREVRPREQKGPARPSPRVGATSAGSAVRSRTLDCAARSHERFHKQGARRDWPSRRGTAGQIPARLQGHRAFWCPESFENDFNARAKDRRDRRGERVENVWTSGASTIARCTSRRCSTRARMDRRRGRRDQRAAAAARDARGAQASVGRHRRGPSNGRSGRTRGDDSGATQPSALRSGPGRRRGRLADTSRDGTRGSAMAGALVARVPA